MATRIEFLRDGFPWNHAPGLLLGVDFPRESRRVHIERVHGHGDEQFLDEGFRSSTSLRGVGSSTR